MPHVQSITSLYAHTRLDSGGYPRPAAVFFCAKFVCLKVLKLHPVSQTAATIYISQL